MEVLHTKNLEHRNVLSQDDVLELARNAVSNSHPTQWSRELYTSVDEGLVQGLQITLNEAETLMIIGNEFGAGNNKIIHINGEGPERIESHFPLSGWAAYLQQLPENPDGSEQVAILLRELESKLQIFSTERAACIHEVIAMHEFAAQNFDPRNVPTLRTSKGIELPTFFKGVQVEPGILAGSLEDSSGIYVCVDGIEFSGQAKSFADLGRTTYQYSVSYGPVHVNPVKVGQYSGAIIEKNGSDLETTGEAVLAKQLFGYFGAFAYSQIERAIKDSSVCWKHSEESRYDSDIADNWITTTFSCKIDGKPVSIRETKSKDLSWGYSARIGGISVVGGIAKNLFRLISDSQRDSSDRGTTIKSSGQ
jgi:hypothetical protein